MPSKKELALIRIRTLRKKAENTPLTAAELAQLRKATKETKED